MEGVAHKRVWGRQQRRVVVGEGAERTAVAADADTGHAFAMGASKAFPGESRTPLDVLQAGASKEPAGFTETRPQSRFQVRHVSLKTV